MQKNAGRYWIRVFARFCGVGATGGEIDFDQSRVGRKAEFRENG